MASVGRRGIQTHTSPQRHRRLAFDRLEDRLLLSGDAYAIDGGGNNLAHPAYGAAGTTLLRKMPVDYADGYSSPAGGNRAGPREISNTVAAQTASVPNDRWLTDYLWQWGQFLDHDIDLTETVVPVEDLPIAVPAGDPYFDPSGTGTAVIGFQRSAYDPATGTSPDNPRQQTNSITAWVDGSQIYGSDAERAEALRTHIGGKLRMSAGNLLPFNTSGLPNAPAPTANYFLAGDIRANENVGLTALHTLFAREHNRLADEISAMHPDFTDEAIYQQARQAVIAQLQAITYREFLPALLGYEAMPSYAGYDPQIQPDIANVFSTAAFRLGHSLLSPELLRLDGNGNVVAAGNLALRDAFFAPHELLATGIEPILAGLGAQLAQELDTLIVDDVRNFLFGQPGAGGFDLASLNIQRGRDHGLPAYNEARTAYGLQPVSRFAHISSDPLLQAKLESVYGNVDRIDVWVGGLAEDHLTGSSLGELLSTILVDQFTRLRDGDRLWYQHQFQNEQLAVYENTTLADVIRRNTFLTSMRDNLFYDQSVLTYQVPAGGEGADLTVKLQEGALVVVDNATAFTLASRPVSSVNKLLLVGSAEADVVTVKAGVATLNLPGGIELYGMDGSDHLIVEATHAHDQVAVSNAQIEINGHTLYHAAWEQITAEGLGGNDTMTTADDVAALVSLAGGPDHDVLHGGAGNDELIGGMGSDYLWGGAGDDYLEGGPGNDTLAAGDGFDQLYGGGDVDRLSGGNDDDRLFGGYGPDTLTGEDGDDSLDGGPGIDHLDGGRGDDVLSEIAGHGHVVGGRGRDHLVITATDGNEVLIAYPDYGQLNSPQGPVAWSEIEQLVVYAGNGDDRAFLYDSSRNDVAVGSPWQVSIAADNGSYSNTVYGFDHVLLTASGGKNDRAFLTDSAADDILVARSDYSIWRAATGDYYLQANRFDAVFARSSGAGMDTAYLYDSTRNDTYTGTPASGVMRSGDYHNSAQGFDRYQAYLTAGGSRDKAYLYDSSGDDVCMASGQQVTLRDVGNTYQHLVTGAEKVYTYATAGGHDLANLYDSAGNDTLRDYDTYSVLEGSGYYVSASGYESLHAVASQGYDELRYYRVKSDGYVYGEGNYVELSAPARFRSATNWDFVKAVAKSGHQPTYELHAVDYVFKSVGNWNSVL